MRSHEQAGPQWGARINSGWPPVTWDCPSWARPSQRDDWEQHGLLLWDHATRTITRISATYTLSILNQLRTTSEWKERGLIVGQPAMRIWLNHPEREAERVLSNGMELSPARSQVVFELLETHEAELQKLRDSEQEERRRRIARAYDLILNFGHDHGQKGKTAGKRAQE